MVTIEEFMKDATSEQKVLLHDIGVAAEKEHDCINEINNIYDSIKNGVYSSDGFSLTVCEDEDDAKVLSMKPREELRKIKKDLKAYFEKAVEIGLGDLGIIQRNYEHYVGEPLS